MQERPPGKSQPIVGLAIIAVAVLLAAMIPIAILWSMGWIDKEDVATASSPVAMATPGSQVTGVAPDQSLLPGESIVTMPPPAKSAIAAPKPTPKPAIAPTPAPVAVPPAEHTEVTHARIVPRDDREICVNCGVIVEAADEPRGDYWDVIVRYDDGTTQTLRYPERQDFRPGERVHLEDGRLLPDRRR